MSHAASIPIASAKATHKGRAGISQRDRPKKMKPWMTWLKLYQSDSCWLFWFDYTVPCHKLTVPHGQIGGRPIANSTAAKTASRSEKRRVGKECVSTRRYRGSP